MENFKLDSFDTKIGYKDKIQNVQVMYGVDTEFGEIDIAFVFIDGTDIFDKLTTKQYNTLIKEAAKHFKNKHVD